MTHIETSTAAVAEIRGGMREVIQYTGGIDHKEGNLVGLETVFEALHFAVVKVLIENSA